METIDSWKQQPKLLSPCHVSHIPVGNHWDLLFGFVDAKKAKKIIVNGTDELPSWIMAYITHRELGNVRGNIAAACTGRYHPG